MARFPSYLTIHLHHTLHTYLQLGIGNTTSAAALTAALTGEAPSSVCGRGTGIYPTGLEHKLLDIQSALAINAELIGTAAGALQAVGGLEIAAMVGAYLQASDLGLPVIVDGFISGTAALVALHMDHKLDRCLFWSHRSHEKGTRILLQAASQVIVDGAETVILPDASITSSPSSSSFPCPSSKTAVAIGGEMVHPPLDMRLRLGEGTGAVLALPLLRCAAAIMREMVSLKDLLSAPSTTVDR